MEVEHLSDIELVFFNSNKVVHSEKSRNVRKRTLRHMSTGKIEIRLRIHAVLT